MKKILSVFATLLFCSALQAAPQTYEIDATHSTVSFKIRHLGISWVTGTFTEFEGTVSLDPDAPEAASIEVTAQAASVNTNNEKRDTHLRSDDFFDVEKHPTLSFKSTSVKKTGEDTYELIGNFTLHGVTQQITVPVTDLGTAEGMQGEARRGGETAFEIKRSDYGMKHMLGPVGDKVRITLAFSTVAKTAE